MALITTGIAKRGARAVWYLAALGGGAAAGQPVVELVLVAGSGKEAEAALRLDELEWQFPGAGGVRAVDLRVP